MNLDRYPFLLTAGRQENITSDKLEKKLQGIQQKYHEHEKKKVNGIIPEESVTVSI